MNMGEGRMTWRLRPFESSDFVMHFSKPPSWFWRFMGSKLLGFKWEKL